MIRPLALPRVLWDFDGTLADTQDAAARMLLRACGREDIRPEDIQDKLANGSREVVEWLGLDYDTVMPVFVDTLAAEPPEGKRLFPLADAALAATGGNLIATNGISHAVAAALEAQGVRGRFGFIIGADSGLERKPATAMYAAAVAETGPIDLVVGDRWLDTVPARELGIPTAAHASPDIEADYHFGDYAEFLCVLLRVVSRLRDGSSTGFRYLDDAIGLASRGLGAADVVPVLLRVREAAANGQDFPREAGMLVSYAERVAVELADRKDDPSRD